MKLLTRTVHVQKPLGVKEIRDTVLLRLLFRSEFTRWMFSSFYFFFLIVFSEVKFRSLCNHVTVFATLKV